MATTPHRYPVKPECPRQTPDKREGDRRKVRTVGSPARRYHARRKGDSASSYCFLPWDNAVSNPKEAAAEAVGEALAQAHIAQVYDAVSAPAHYVGSGGIQPIDYVMSNKMPFAEGNVVKYITRHSAKNGAEDVRKAIAYCNYILTKVYNQKP